MQAKIGSRLSIMIRSILLRLLNAMRFNYSNVIHYVTTYVSVSLIIVGGLYLSTTISGYNQFSLDNPVDKRSCDCSCWDGFYRGIHGRGSGYKAFYFNYDPHWVFILLLFLLFSYLLFQIMAKTVQLLIYESTWILIKVIEWLFKRQVSFFSTTEIDTRYLTYQNENESNQVFIENNLKIPILKTHYLRLRVFVFASICVSIYSNYYGIWSFINYLNDRDYRMIRSQFFYALTEIVPTFIYFKTLDRYVTIKLVEYNESFTKIVKLKYVFKHHPIDLSYIWPLLNISILHILLALPEGMFTGYFKKSVEKEINLQMTRARNFRDLALMTTDFIGITISFFVILKEFLRIRMKEDAKKQSSICILKFIFNRIDLKLWTLASILLYVSYKQFCTF